MAELSASTLSERVVALAMQKWYRTYEVAEPRNIAHPPLWALHDESTFSNVPLLGLNVHHLRQALYSPVSNQHIKQRLEEFGRLGGQHDLINEVKILRGDGVTARAESARMKALGLKNNSILDARKHMQQIIGLAKHYAELAYRHEYVEDEKLGRWAKEFESGSSE
ncbi:hypothetical protein HK104_006492, partial [Borealophlyctis nickersoniae]